MHLLFLLSFFLLKVSPFLFMGIQRALNMFTQCDHY